MTKPVTKPVTILDKNTKNGKFVVEAVVSVSVMVSAESISQLEFRFRYRTETKIMVSVRVSVQGVKSLGGLFAGFEFYEVKKKLSLFFKTKMEILLHF